MANRVNDSELLLPPGFRFHPTDDELVHHYLLRKCTAAPLPAPIIAELDLYKFDPWLLPEKALHGEKEWYFFSPRDRKYPNGSRPNRAAGNGYWKATGADKPIGSPRTVAIKKSLVFYSGKAPNGEKTNWIMHEYRLAGVDRSARKKNCSLRLDDWVLCRLYHKKGALGKTSGPKRAKFAPVTTPLETKPEAIDNSLQEPPVPSEMPKSRSQYISFESPEPMQWLVGGSSSSEQVWSSSDDHLHEPEVESQLSFGEDWVWDEAIGFGELDDVRNVGLVELNGDAQIGFEPFSPFFSSSFQDTFMYFHEPI